MSILTIAHAQFEDQRDVRDDRSDIPSGISRLILKNMRFRDLEGTEPSEGKRMEAVEYPSRVNTGHANALAKLQTFLRITRNPMLKRERNRHLMNNLAEMLSGNRERDSGSALRMPSLRFG